MHRLLKILLFIVLLPYGLSVPYQFIHPPSTLMLYDLLRLDLPERDWVPLSKISPNLKRAVVTAEDSAFCSHWGFDFKQMGKSIERAERSDRAVRATSTITQQLAKNLFLWHGRSWLRKLLEIPLTLWLELTWSKPRILETYLNIAEWDEGIYGAEAAARFHFGTSAASLNTVQAALLATSLPNPIQRSASRPGSTQTAMAAQLVGRMHFNGADISCIH